VDFPWRTEGSPAGEFPHHHPLHFLSQPRSNREREAAFPSFIHKCIEDENYGGQAGLNSTVDDKEEERTLGGH